MSMRLDARGRPYCGLDFSKKQAHRALRAEVFERDDFTCRACGWRPPNERIPHPYDGRRTIEGPCNTWRGYRHLQVDHIVPLFHGGALDDPANLQTLCEVCNTRKGAVLR